MGLFSKKKEFTYDEVAIMSPAEIRDAVEVYGLQPAFLDVVRKRLENGQVGKNDFKKYYYRFAVDEFCVYDACKSGCVVDYNMLPPRLQKESFIAFEILRTQNIRYSDIYEELRNDDSFNKLVVRHQPMLLKEMSYKTRNNADVVFCATRVDVASFKYAGDDISCDERTVFNFMRQINPEVFKYAHDDLRNDPEVVDDAIKNINVNCAFYAGDHLLNDVDWVKKTLKNYNVQLYPLCGPNIRADYALTMMYAATNGTEVVGLMSQKIKDNEDHLANIAILAMLGDVMKKGENSDETFSQLINMIDLNIGEKSELNMALKAVIIVNAEARLKKYYESRGIKFENVPKDEIKYQMRTLTENNYKTLDEQWKIQDEDNVHVENMRCAYLGKRWTERVTSDPNSPRFSGEKKK